MSIPATVASLRPFLSNRHPCRRARRSQPRPGLLTNGLAALTLAILVGITQARTATANAPTDAAETTVPNLAPGYAEIDIDAFWRDIFTAAGFAYSTPAVVPFSTPLNSGCGYVTPAELIAFYCAADVAVYWSTPSYNQAYLSGGDAAWVNVMAHEWSHHAQVLLGTNSPWRRANDIVNLELEATCMGGVYVGSALDRGLVTDEMITTMVGMFVGSPYHGTTYQVQTAFLGGLHSGISACGLALPEPAAQPVTSSPKASAVAEDKESERAADPRPAQVTTAALNLRAEPSLSAPVRSVLTPSSRIEVTGEAQPGDGYTWYPVIDLDTGLTGFVAAPFITL